MTQLILELRRLLHSLLYFVVFLLIWIAAGITIAGMTGLLANSVGFEFSATTSILARVGLVLSSLCVPVVLLRRFWKFNQNSSPAMT